MSHNQPSAFQEQHAEYVTGFKTFLLVKFALQYASLLIRLRKQFLIAKIICKNRDYHFTLSFNFK